MEDTKVKKEKKDKRGKGIIKKVLIGLLAFIVVIGFISCIGGGDSKDELENGLKDGMEAAMDDTAETEESDDAEKEEATDTASAEEETPVAEDTAEQDTDETAAAEESNAVVRSTTGGINTLMNAKLTVRDVRSGSGDKIGERAFIVADKEYTKMLSSDDLKLFCDEVVEDSGYNWISIDFCDGTGICFPGSMSYFATYGTIDNEGCIDELKGNITLQEDGTYKYTEIGSEE